MTAGQSIKIDEAVAGYNQSPLKENKDSCKIYAFAGYCECIRGHGEVI